ncbi:hypothetical protein KW783_01605 [Candidatus Parcubacteria bacterium]|nr:hypothetical protein [Candidatus Parcubacteria bacterium]
MTPEEKEMLERALNLAEENNKMLRGMRRSMRVGTILRVVYWIIIIGLAFGSFYFLQPYLNQLGEVYTGFKDNVDSVHNFISPNEGSATQ